MKITGVIAEYNPFHNGHKYQLEAARKLTGADYILVVMNGDFMQRGLPAFWNKYARAEMAIQNGADAVIELPTLYGTASAEYFALGGIRLLHQLGCIDHVCFGCETEQLPLLDRIADLLLQEPESYRQVLNRYLNQGVSFPKARTQAILTTLPLTDKTLPKSNASSPSGTGLNGTKLDGAIFNKSELETLLTKPNTILAIEYLKAIKKLNSPILPVPCLRTDAGYHSEQLQEDLASATAIRKEYLETGCTPALEQTVPPSVFASMKQSYQKEAPVTMEDFYPYLQYALWKPIRPLTEYLDIHEDLANRISSVYQPDYSYVQLVEAIVSKQLTYTRVQRALLHILLDIRKEEMTRQLESDSLHYARLLAFRQEAAPLLRKLKRNSKIPIINRLKNGQRLLENAGDTEGISLLNLDISSAHLYEQTRCRHYGIPAVNEYTQGVLMGNSCHD